MDSILIATKTEELELDFKILRGTLFVTFKLVGYIRISVLQKKKKMITILSSTKVSRMLFEQCY